MNAILNSLLSLWQNKHTSGAAIVFFSMQAAAVVWPKYADKINEISKLAVVYGLLRAGDARQVAAVKSDVADLKSGTVSLTKADVPPTVKP